MRAGWVNLVENPLEAPRMKLEGIHHVSSITGDAQANVDFYAGTLGLRLVKKTVNRTTPPSITSSTATTRAAPVST